MKFRIRGVLCCEFITRGSLEVEETFMTHAEPTAPAQPHEESDEALMLELSRDISNRAALDHLCNRYWKHLYFYHSRTFSHSDAEDLAQATFLRVLQRARQFNPDRAPFKAWLYGIAHHVGLDFQRVKCRRYDDVQIEDLEARTAGSLEFLDNRCLDLRKAIGCLPELHREVVMLMYFDHLSTKEIALILGIKKGTVSSRLSNAYEKLKNNLSLNTSSTEGSCKKIYASEL